jgi:hypothetical protein
MTCGHLFDDRPEETVLPLETGLILSQEPVAFDISQILLIHALDQPNDFARGIRHIACGEETCPPLLQPQEAQNVLGELLINLTVAGHRLLLACPLIHVDVVMAAGSKKDATLLLKPTKQIASFHAMTTSRIWYCSGTSSSAISMNASRMFSSSSSCVRPWVMISGCSSSLPNQNFLLFQ